MRLSWSILGIVAFVAVCTTAALAMGIPPTEWPIKRLIANLEARLVESPDDPQTHYTLGRTHGFAFALERSTLWAADTSSGPWLKDLDWQRRKMSRTKEGSLTPSELLVHLTEGVRHLQRACQLNVSLYWVKNYELSLAWLLEMGAHLANRVDTIATLGLGGIELSEDDVTSIRQLLHTWSQDRTGNVLRQLIQPGFLDKAARYCSQRYLSPNGEEQDQIDRLLRRYWLEQSIEHYRRAVERCIAEIFEDAAMRDRLTLSMALEAYQSYARLVRERGFRDQAEETYVSQLEGRMKELEKLQVGNAVSPILFSLAGCKTLGELITPDLAVPFDLNGDGIDELWPWIAPDAGWLVWDPKGRGEITSGQQLFGTASAWLFFEDGYHVLDALDDDRDGRLMGLELAGIAVWFDRDTDGVSDRGEVIPVEELGIVALATEATETIGRSLGNPCGVELADGRVLPTFDWVLESVAGP